VLLSGLTRAAGVVLTAKANVRVKHIEFRAPGAGARPVVLVAEDGQVENRVLNLPIGLPASGADRGVELPQRPCPRQDPRGGEGGARSGARSRPRRARSIDPEDRRRQALRAGPAASATSAG